MPDVSTDQSSSKWDHDYCDKHYTHYIGSFLTAKSHDHTETTTSKVTTKHVPITQQTATPPAGQTSVALPVTDAYTNLKTVLPDPIENDSKSTSHLRAICLLA